MLIIRYIAPCHLSHSSTFFRLCHSAVILSGWVLEYVSLRLIKYIVPDPMIKWLSFIHIMCSKNKTQGTRARQIQRIVKFLIYNFWWTSSGNFTSIILLHAFVLWQHIKENWNRKQAICAPCEKPTFPNIETNWIAIYWFMERWGVQNDNHFSIHFATTSSLAWNATHSWGKWYQSFVKNRLLKTLLLDVSCKVSVLRCFLWDWLQYIPLNPWSTRKMCTENMEKHTSKEWTPWVRNGTEQCDDEEGWIQHFTGTYIFSRASIIFTIKSILRKSIMHYTIYNFTCLALTHIHSFIHLCSIEMLY